MVAVPPDRDERPVRTFRLSLDRGPIDVSDPLACGRQATHFLGVCFELAKQLAAVEIPLANDLVGTSGVDRFAVWSEGKSADAGWVAQLRAAEPSDDTGGQRIVRWKR